MTALRLSHRSVATASLIALLATLAGSAGGQQPNRRRRQPAAHAGQPAASAATPVTAANVTSLVYQMVVAGNRVGEQITIKQIAPAANGAKQWEGSARVYREVSRNAAANTLQLASDELGITVDIDLNAKTLYFSNRSRTRHDVLSATAPTPGASTRTTGGPRTRVVQEPVISGTPEQKLVRRRLGYGYDATGDFALPTGLRAPIFDLSDNASFRMVGRLTDSGTHSLDITTGSSASEFSRNLSVKAGASGSVGLFAASVKVGVNTSTTRTQSAAFALVDDKWVFFTAALERPQQLALLPQALRELQNMPVKMLLAKYGTHYTNGLEFGGHLTYTTSKSFERTVNLSQVKVEAEAQYMAFSGSGSVAKSSSSDVSTSNSLSNFRISGGKAGTNALLPSYWTEPKYYQQWVRDIPAGSDIAGLGTGSSAVRGAASARAGGGSQGLMGLWTVPGLTPERAKEIEDQVKIYITRSQGTMFNQFSRPAAEPLKKDAIVVLKTVQDGTYLGPGEIWTIDGYHYAKVAERAQAQRHGFDSGTATLTSGNTVKLKILNPGAKYGSYLASPRAANDCYYSSGNGGYETWRIWLGGKGMRTGEAIYSGDTVVIENVSWSSRYLTPDSDGFLEVQSDQPTEWQVVLAPFPAAGQPASGAVQTQRGTRRRRPQ